MAVRYKGALVAALEFKSQVGSVSIVYETRDQTYPPACRPPFQLPSATVPTPTVAASHSLTGPGRVGEAAADEFGQLI